MYDAQSLLNVVDAASSMVMGEARISASGKTTPHAARCTSGCALRATTAASAGISPVMMSQLAASGHHVRKI
ncbi:MAG: hypothetical protein R2854_25705 [Caldilineaceae bacterium]